MGRGAGIFLAGQFKVVGRQSVTETTAAGVDLYEDSLGFLAPLQLDKVVTAAQRTKLAQTAFRSALAAPRNFPVVVHRDAVTFGPAAVNPRAVFADIIVGSTSDQLFKLAF